MIPEYKYQTKDYSLITPFFRTKIVTPLMRFIPWGLPANIITVISNLFMFASVILPFVLEPSENKFLYIIIPIFVIIYAIGDHIDGMQAKRTGTSSALGEFFDHYLDIFNNGILLVALFKLFYITNPLLLAFFFSVGYLAHAAIFQEQFDTKWLIFEKFGSLETVFLLSSIIFLGFFETFFNFLGQKIYMEFSLLETVFTFSTLGAILTMIKTLFRAKIKTPKFYLFAFFQIVSSYIIAILFPDSVFMIFFIITFYSAIYIGNLQKGHLADGISRWPNWVVPIMLCTGLFFPNINIDYLRYTILLYLIVYITHTVVYTIYTLRQYWVWINPKK